jgi:hypothetical protein
MLHPQSHHLNKNPDPVPLGSNRIGVSSQMVAAWHKRGPAQAHWHDTKTCGTEIEVGVGRVSARTNCR